MSRDARSTRTPSGAAAERIGPAVTLVLVAAVLIPVMDGIAKLLTTRYPVAQVVWARYFVHFMLLCPVLLGRYGTRALWPHRPGLQLVRSALLLTATGLFFGAIAAMPLTDALALVFVSPLVVTALSPVVLGEEVGARRWAAVWVGFAGALIVIQPGFGVFQWAGLLAMGAGVGFACYVLVTRKLARSDPVLVTWTHTALVGAVAMTAVVPIWWVTPSMGDAALMALLGVLAAGGHWCIIRAYERAPASLLAPYGYAELVTATLFGYLVFGDFPMPLTWLGIATITASGVYVSWYESRTRTGG